MRTLFLSQAAKRQSIIVWELSLTGKILPSASVFSLTPLLSNQLTVSSVPNWAESWASFLLLRGSFLIRWWGSLQALVTLHRPPPETFTLDRSLGDFSNTVTLTLGCLAERLAAAKIPAAPAPIMMI